jgi:hypothetical protein
LIKSSTQQWTAPSIQRRFASDDAVAKEEGAVASTGAPEQTISEELVVEPATAAEAEVVAEEAAAAPTVEPTEEVESVEQDAFGTANKK